MAIPWAHLIRYAPQLISLSRDLLQRSRDTQTPAQLPRGEGRAERTDLAPRVAALEENERRQAELVEKMAQQHAELARAVFTLHRRGRWLIGALVVLAVITALLAWRVFTLQG